jgi:hypothetical protein
MCYWSRFIHLPEKSPFNERIPYTTKQQGPAARSPGRPNTNLDWKFENALNTTYNFNDNDNSEYSSTPGDAKIQYLFDSLDLLFEYCNYVNILVY